MGPVLFGLSLHYGNGTALLTMEMFSLLSTNTGDSQQAEAFANLRPMIQNLTRVLLLGTSSSSPPQGVFIIAKRDECAARPLYLNLK
jgi:hypothetical protein